MAGETTIAILRRLIDISQGALPKGAAEAVLQLQLSASDQQRMGELASSSTAGTLTGVEAEEYDALIAAADLISLWKSKARLSLSKQTSAA